MTDAEIHKWLEEIKGPIYERHRERIKLQRRERFTLVSILISLMPVSTFALSLAYQGYTVPKMWMGLY